MSDLGAQIPHAVSIDVRNIVAAFSKSSRSQLAQSLTRFTNALARDTSSVSRSMAELHSHVGTRAKRRVYEAYKTSGIGTRASYRDQAEGKLRRYSRGAMDRALKSNEFVRFDHRRLEFINMKLMDREAKQWYRLNFGAGPAGRGGRAPKIKNWRMGKSAIPFTLSLSSYGKSKNFRVPHSLRYSGAWSNNFSPTNLSLAEIHRNPAKGGGGALYLVPMRRASGRSYWENRVKDSNSRGGWRPVKARLSPELGTTRGTWSKGIRGAHFLEQGIDYINKEYPRQLNSLLDTWFNVAKDSIGRRRPFVWKPI